MFALLGVFCVALRWCLLTLSGGDVTHYVPTTQPEQPHDKEGGGGGVDGVRLLPDAAKKPNICPSIGHISVHARLLHIDGAELRKRAGLCPCSPVDGAIT